ncbi:exopolyphosphatase / guanosine-5'-triphosphate,3'-diphosphate pyrophosphatase [Evansella caseinilytica]|uniref:exopolyphosphatase n=1 Tax=Evansella caseinilytica TaxID=1503961 RepID=A0A1H3KLB1_9BACI|nr:exopolyphosphatase [Evansella caseinilytica]SDY52983.1 exopolyphosphatase / guanosine-5'-triphosphate,3'-diphosphate pyrophosphatase [Evansella caseinilytica]
MKQQQIGILDMGSNSIRLVIYTIDENGCTGETLNLKVTARLSSHIDSDGHMSKSGIEVILQTLERFSHIVKQYPLTDLRCVATAAVRNAKNRDDVLQTIAENSDFSIDILSEREEAFYGYLAVTNSTGITDGISIDIGGGSTEITSFHNRELIHYHSFPFGAVTLKNDFFRDAQPTRSEMKQLTKFLQASFAELPWIRNKQVPVIGIGGSARNLALVHQQHVRYPLAGLHQYEMDVKDVQSVNKMLMKMTNQQRQLVDGLSKDRSDIIIPAITALELLLHAVQAPKFFISTKGLREGLFYEMYLQPFGIRQFPNVAEESLYQLSIDYSLNPEHQKQLAVLGTFLFQALNPLLDEPLSKTDLYLLRWSAKIFYIGSVIYAESRSQHTFYLLTNTSIDGLTHEERLAVACIASFKSRSQLKQYIAPFRHWLSAKELKKYELLGAIVKLSFALDSAKLQTIRSIQVEKVSNQLLILHIYHEGDSYFEKQHAEKNKKHLERALAKHIRLDFHDICMK